MGSISKASEIKVQLNQKDPIKVINQKNVGGPMMSASSTHQSFKTSPFGETMSMNNNGTHDGSNKMFPDMKQVAPIPSYNLENIQLNLNNVKETQGKHHSIMMSGKSFKGQKVLKDNYKFRSPTGRDSIIPTESNEQQLQLIPINIKDSNMVNGE